VSTIRPTGFAPTPPTAAPQRTDAARLDAQRAFFQMATGQAPAAARSPGPAAASAPLARPDRIPAPSAQQPSRALRPGSLLDIRV
jgi:hypothetical protein